MIKTENEKVRTWDHEGWFILTNLLSKHCREGPDLSSWSLRPAEHWNQKNQQPLRLRFIYTVRAKPVLLLSQPLNLLDIAIERWKEKPNGGKSPLCSWEEAPKEPSPEPALMSCCLLLGQWFGFLKNLCSNHRIALFTFKGFKEHDKHWAVSTLKEVFH